jgi:hypothetical protein
MRWVVSCQHPAIKQQNMPASYMFSAYNTSFLGFFCVIGLLCTPTIWLVITPSTMHAIVVIENTVENSWWDMMGYGAVLRPVNCSMHSSCHMRTFNDTLEESSPFVTWIYYNNIHHCWKFMVGVVCGVGTYLSAVQCIAVIYHLPKLLYSFSNVVLLWLVSIFYTHSQVKFRDITSP